MTEGTTLNPFKTRALFFFYIVISAAIRMMSAIETGAAVYQPAQLLNWMCMSLQESQTNAFDAFRPGSEGFLDLHTAKRCAADLSSPLNSNYLNSFLQLKSEV